MSEYYIATKCANNTDGKHRTTNLGDGCYYCNIDTMTDITPAELAKVEEIRAAVLSDPLVQAAMKFAMYELRFHQAVDSRNPESAARWWEKRNRAFDEFKQQHPSEWERRNAQGENDANTY